MCELSGSEQQLSVYSGQDIAEEELIEAFDKMNSQLNIFAETEEDDNPSELTNDQAEMS